MTFARRFVALLAAFVTLLAAWVQKGRKWRPKTARKPLSAEGASRPAAKKRWRWWLSRAHSDRERVIHVYLQMLQQGEAIGARRRQHQTPYEYAPILHRALRDAERDIKGLTDVFVHVRYSPEPADADHAEKALTHGEGVQQALQQWRHRHEADS